ncbi:hypothetical protein [Richelia sinica]|uniref:hypothetical protein n=1 Tax=Richelia sinica TaxID=1357545 RepID=UPI001684DE9B|nr:hypothetical protein [Richelia sinica]
MVFKAVHSVGDDANNCASPEVEILTIIFLPTLLTEVAISGVTLRLGVVPGVVGVIIRFAGIPNTGNELKPGKEKTPPLLVVVPPPLTKPAVPKLGDVKNEEPDEELDEPPLEELDDPPKLCALLGNSPILKSKELKPTLKSKDLIFITVIVHKGSIVNGPDFDSPIETTKKIIDDW